MYDISSVGGARVEEDLKEDYLHLVSLAIDSFRKPVGITVHIDCSDAIDHRPQNTKRPNVFA